MIRSTLPAEQPNSSAICSAVFASLQYSRVISPGSISYGLAKPEQ